MRRLADTRVLFAGLSIVIASIMWLYVATDKNPIVERFLTLDVHVRGLSPSEVVVQAPDSVRVRFRGSRSAVALLTPDVLDASIDLTGLRAGAHQVPIDVATPAGDIRVVERTPPEALVVLDTLTSKRLPVEISLIGAPPQGFTLGSARIDPSLVTISGLAGQVEEVRHAVVTLDTTRLRQQVVSSLQVRLLDANGQEVRGVMVTPSIVEATLPVRTGLITKVVPVVPVLLGVPAAGLTVRGVAPIPETVSVSGPSDALEAVQTVSTVPVDVSGGRQSVVRQTPLALPPGVTVLPRNVTVAVRIGPALLSRILAGVPIRLVGVPSGLSARAAPDHVSVTVEGPQQLVTPLMPSAVEARLDLAGLRPGAYRLAPVLVAPAGTRSLGMSPAQVTVTVAADR